MRLSLLRGLLALGSISILAPIAHAQDDETPSAAVLRPVPGPDTDAALVGAVERVLRSKLDELAPLRVTGTPNLELRDLQLAVGCMSEDDSCLHSIAEQLEVDSLVVSHVDHAGDALVATITLYDARNDESTEATARAQSENALLEAIDPAVRELFGLPAAERPVGEYEGGGGGGGGGGGAVRVEPSGLGVVPFILASAGLAVGGAGVYFALKSRASERDYADAPTGNTDEVDAAIELRDDAEQQALLANILFGVGGGLVALGLTLFILDLASSDSGETEVVASPTLSPDGVGLVLAGTLGGAW